MIDIKIDPERSKESFNPAFFLHIDYVEIFSDEGR